MRFRFCPTQAKLLAESGQAGMREAQTPHQPVVVVLLFLSVFDL